MYIHVCCVCLCMHATVYTVHVYMCNIPDPLLSQECYWSGKTAKDHDRSKHFMEEYCISVSYSYIIYLSLYIVYLLFSLMKEVFSFARLVIVERKSLPVRRLLLNYRQLVQQTCKYQLTQMSYVNSCQLQNVNLGKKYYQQNL